MPRRDLVASGRFRVAAFVIAVLAFLAVGYAVLKLLPDWLANTNGLDTKGRVDERQSVRTASLALLAGAVAVVGAVYTARSYSLTRAGQITDRFSKAIEQPGSAALEVRLGAIYALERIARDSSQDHQQVMEVLTAYVRERARWNPEPPQYTETTDPPRPPSDIEAVMRVIGRRTLRHEPAPVTACSCQPPTFAALTSVAHISSGPRSSALISMEQVSCERTWRGRRSGMPP